MKIEITNSQQVKRINLRRLHAALKKICARLKSYDSAVKRADVSSKKLSILLCDNLLIKSLNKKYLRKSSVTDVITFDLNDEIEPDYLGEVVVSVEEAVEVSRRRSERWQDELMLYLTHGVLHLLGYDDSTEVKREVMEDKQKELLEKSVFKF